MAYFHSTPYYPYSTNTTVPTSSPFYPSYTTPSYSTNTYITAPSPSFCFNHGYTPPTPTPSSPPNPYISSLSRQTPLPSRLEMKLSIFDGSEDAYWWILCSEKSFNTRGRRVSDAEKLMECAFAMKGFAFTWWQNWYLTNPKRSWDSFTCALLWHFKPEWRPLLPIEGEEEATKETAENEKLQQPQEEEIEVIDSVQKENSTSVEEPTKLVDGSNFLSITNFNFQIFEEENKEEKEKESKTQHDFISTSLCPNPPPTTQFSSNLPPAPPSTPPDQVSHLLATLSSQPLPPPKPPDQRLLTIYSPLQRLSVLVSPKPPPEPPDKIFALFTSLKPPSPKSPDEVLIPLVPPPPKPPDIRLPFSVAHLQYYTHSEIFVVKELFDFLSLKGAHQTQSPPLDPSIMALEKSQPCAESTIRVRLYCPIMRRHVVLLVPYSARYQLFSQKILPHAPINLETTPSIYFPWSLSLFAMCLNFCCTPTAECKQYTTASTTMTPPISIHVLILQKTKSTCPFVTPFRLAINSTISVSFQGQHVPYSCTSAPYKQTKSCSPTRFRPNEIVCYGSLLFYGTNSLSALLHNSVGPSCIRPARKPPDLFVNLEDKVLVQEWRKDVDQLSIILRNIMKIKSNTMFVIAPLAIC